MDTTKPFLYLVLGGRVGDTQGYDFENVETMDMVGIYPTYKKAYNAWRGKSQQHVDDAHTKYVIVPLHRLLDPEHMAAPDKDPDGD